MRRTYWYLCVINWSLSALFNSDLHLYRGEWLSADEDRQRGGSDNRKARAHFKEIVALNIFITLSSATLDMAHFTIVLLAKHYAVLDHY